MSYDKDIDKLRQTAERSGWKITRRGSGSHEMWYSPDGKSILTVSTNKSSRRNWQNLTARLRRAGLKI